MARLVFVIPLQTKARCSDWKKTCWLLERTLKSIQAQDSDDHHTILVCTDVPDIEITSESVTILETPIDYNGDTTLAAGRIDKQRKLMAGLLAAREHQPDYAMFVDGDDLLHRKLVSHVFANDEHDGFLLTRGYRHIIGQDWLRKSLSFHKACGSSAVFPYRQSDFVDATSDEDYPTHYMTAHAHNRRIAKDFSERGIKYQRIPFFAAVYTKGHAGGLSALSQRSAHASSESSIGSRGRQLLRLWYRRICYKLPGWLLGPQKIDDTILRDFQGLKIAT